MEKANKCQETVKFVSIVLCFILQGRSFHTPQRTEVCCGFFFRALLEEFKTARVSCFSSQGNRFSASVVVQRSVTNWP